jgi:amidase
MQPSGRAALGIAAGAAVLEAADAFGGRVGERHGQRAIIPRPVASAAVTSATDPVFAGLARQAELIAAGDLSSRELTEACLERIARLDPTLNAFRVVLAERALAEAAQADGRRGSGDRRPLLGVPVAIKDDTDVAGEVTARGSNAFGEPASTDAEVVRRLRAAGAVIIGKTSVPELEITPFTETPTFGVTRNPWDLNRTPGGSSGGSASAVAAGLAGGALGSDGGGSIRIPAGCCGLFGLKTQRGRISLAPKDGAWHGLSVYGPIVRHVADAALFIDATSDGEPLASAVTRTPGHLRIAVSAKLPPPILGSPDAEQRGALDAAAELLRGLGHEVVERDPEYGAGGSAFTARYFRGIHDEGRAMAHPERLSRRTRGFIRLGAAIAPPLLERARRDGAAAAERFGRLFEQADVLLTPMFTRRPIPIGTYEGRGALWSFNGYSRWVPYCAAFNHSGQPAASVPVGFTPDGFPLAVQLVGRPHDEATLLSLAAQIEQERPWAERVPDIST